MRFDLVRAIYFKELLDLIRDRRTLISMVVLPLLVIPLLMVGATRVIDTISKRAEQDAKTMGIVVRVTTPGLREAIARSGSPIVDRDPFKDAIEKKQIAAAVEETNNADGKAVISIYVDRSNPTSAAAGDRLRILIDEFRESRIRASLAERGVPLDVLSPFTVKRENVAADKKMAGVVWGSMLGYILLLLMFTGGMYPAIDMTAGEKERKTLEMFLSSPAARSEIVLGKILATMTAIFLTAILTLLSLVVSLKNAGIGGGNARMEQMLGTIPLDAASLGLIVLAIFPLSVFAASSMIAIALFAKSFKEGQSYLTPLMMVVIFPALMGGLPGLELTPLLALAPIFNVSQLLRGILTGDYTVASFAVTMVANLVYAAIAFFIARRTFENESVLFRT
jgi:sodium transport system permease protein